MRYEMRTERIGEWVTTGSVDDWLAAHAESGVRALTDEQVAMVRTLATEPPGGRFWLVRTGEYWHKLHAIGLYDGWVYWKPRICLLTDGPIPVDHTHEAYDLDAISLGERCERNVFPFNGWRRVEVPDAA